MIDSTTFAGLLLESPSLAPVRRDEVERSPSLSFVRVLTSSRWEEYKYRSTVALRGELLPAGTSLFDYRVLIRRSGPRLIVVSETAHIVDRLLRMELAKVVHPRMRVLEFDVDRLVRDIAASPGDYVLSYVTAKVPAGGDDLRTISFFGNNVGDTELFRENLPRLTAYRCGLRSQAVEEEGGSSNEDFGVQGPSEVLRLAATGGITFPYNSALDLDRLVTAVGYVTANYLRR